MKKQNEKIELSKKIGSLSDTIIQMLRQVGDEFSLEEIIFSVVFWYHKEKRRKEKYEG
ncbi:hypothetical protein [Acetivibrio sp. MSJd-27]|uniref:hypothetical protein n=1 Tax=Acetivibrio sp. MSJd-27 TaxID=2841523 RepID=UPI001C0F7747|nr:hypothetical protein [Acetivibrio sp. MSJd-27]MBU5451407.1 hypothetical protein [Acetivibrio sp. MSJd-27]